MLLPSKVSKPGRCVGISWDCCGTMNEMTIILIIFAARTGSLGLLDAVGHTGGSSKTVRSAQGRIITIAARTAVEGEW